MKCRSVKPKPWEVRRRWSVFGPGHEKGSSSAPGEAVVDASLWLRPSFCLAWRKTRNLSINHQRVQFVPHLPILFTLNYRPSQIYLGSPRLDMSAINDARLHTHTHTHIKDKCHCEVNNTLTVKLHIFSRVHGWGQTQLQNKSATLLISPDLCIKRRCFAKTKKNVFLQMKQPVAKARVL